MQFFDLSEMVNEDEIIQWEWDFGDGNSSYDSSPQHTYNDYGDYDVTLTVMSNYGLYSFPHLEEVILTDSFGDLNEDGSIDVVDIIQLVNYVLENTMDQDFGLYDLNLDFQINVLDIILLVQIIID